jgi:hypothetical protein
VSLYLNGLNALTVFDIASSDTVPPGGQTPNSQAGWTWTCDVGDCGDPAINVTYNWRVSIGLEAAQGDLWQTVRVDFADVGPDGNFSFVQDTDNDLRLINPGNPVPEPGSFALLCAGLAATRFFRRRR